MEDLLTVRSRTKQAHGIRLRLPETPTGYSTRAERDGSVLAIELGSRVVLDAHEENADPDGARFALARRVAAALVRRGRTPYVVTDLNLTVLSREHDREDALRELRRQGRLGRAAHVIEIPSEVCIASVFPEPVGGGVS